MEYIIDNVTIVDILEDRVQMVDGKDQKARLFSSGALKHSLKT